MIRKYLQIMIVLMITMSANAQIPEIPKNMLSPNATSLGEYGEVPVSPFTGIPQIEIPLYEIKVGDFKMPITMSYHAGGIRPDQHPGWTGLGWTLNAGGCISRVVNDMADEYNNIKNPSGSPYMKEAGYIYKFDNLKLDWSNKTSLRKGIENAISNNCDFYDTEPDVFSFNFGGYSGKFYINSKGEWQVQCDKSIKVSTSDTYTMAYAKESPTFNVTGTDINGIGRSHSFKTFVITVEDGTKFIFGDNDNAIEYSVGFFSQNIGQLIANTWHLRSIILVNGDKIDFSYDRGDFIAQLYISFYVRLRRSYAPTFNSGCTEGSGVNLNDGYEGELIIPSYLKEIKYKSIKIEFERELSNELKYDYDRVLMYKRNMHINDLDGFLPILQNNGKYEGEKNYPNCLNGLKWYKLKNIKINDTITMDHYRYKLEYNDISNQRLMLKSITQVNENYPPGKRVYLFDYYSPELLPQYCAKETDHWGYYNNKTSDTDILKYASTREPNTNVSLYGSLSKITYPTKGYSRFEYENHNCIKFISDDRTSCYSIPSNLTAGGLRIKSILKSDTGNANDEYTDRKYFYVTDYMQNKDYSYRSSGILGHNAKYSFNNYVVKSADNEYTITMDVFSSQSVLPVCGNSSGIHIGYSEVIEKYSDGSFTRYKYTNYDNGHADSKNDVTVQESHTIYEPYSGRDQERGLLKELENYDASSVLKSKRIMEYEKSDNSDINYVKSVRASYSNICSSPLGYNEGTAYRFYTYTMRKIKEIETVYDNDNDTQNITTYSYNYWNLLTAKTKTINSDEILRVSYKYPNSYVEIKEFNPILADIFHKHMLNYVVETKSELIKNNASHMIERIRYNYANRYRPDSVERSIGNNPYELRTKYKYDIMWNPIYIEKDVTDKTVYVWGYNYQYLVAEIKNTTLSEVDAILGGINNFSKSKVPNIMKLNKLRTLLPKALVTTYDYHPLMGLILKIDPSGVSTHYEYDILGRLILIKDSKGNVIEHYKYNYKQN